MLRNFDFDSLLVWVFALLNEVLSLNAQEFVPIAGKTAAGLSSMKS